MNRSGKKLGIILFLLLWFFFVSLPALSFLLATREQVQIGDENNHIRLFLIQDNKTEGIGLERVRPHNLDLPCNQTRVRYLMWSGKPENVTFCQCFDPANYTPLPATPGPCLTAEN